jgi:hypothetical protein
MNGEGVPARGGKFSVPTCRATSARLASSVLAMIVVLLTVVDECAKAALLRR